MRITRARLLTMLALIWMLAPHTVLAKPDIVPVKVQCAVPAGMKTGDEADVVVRFGALADIEQLSVTVFGDSNLQVLSEITEAVFTNLKRGNSPELPIRVRLTGPKVGGLAVTYTVQTPNGPQSSAVRIVFGDTK